MTSFRYTCSGYLPWKQHPVGHYLERVKALVEAGRLRGKQQSLPRAGAGDKLAWQ